DKGVPWLRVVHHHHIYGISFLFIDEGQDSLGILIGNPNKRGIRKIIGPGRLYGIHLQSFFVYIVKKGVHLIVILLGNRIVFMVMAFGTFQRDAQNSGTQGIGPIHYVVKTIFFRDNPSFLGYGVVPVK